MVAQCGPFIVIARDLRLTIRNHHPMFNDNLLDMLFSEERVPMGFHRSVELVIPLNQGTIE